MTKDICIYIDCFSSKSLYDDDDDKRDMDKKDPWKALNDLNKSKDSKKNIEPKLSAYDRQLLDEMRVTSPKQRLTTISEDIEKSRLKNKFLKANNKLVPYDDRSDSELFNKSKNSTSWAITDNNYSGKYFIHVKLYNNVGLIKLSLILRNEIKKFK